MKRRHFLSLALAASLATSLGLAPQAALADDSPVSIVTMFYKVSAGKDGKYSGKSIYYQDSIRAKYFSKDLRRTVVAFEKKSREKDGLGLDFDPVTDSQDPSVKALKIEQDGESDGEAAVNASFGQEGGTQRKVVRYVFVRQDNAWKLNNMTSGTGDDGWDLRKLIKANMDDYSK